MSNCFDKIPEKMYTMLGITTKRCPPTSISGGYLIL